MDYVETYCSDCVNWKDTAGIGTEGCYVMDIHSLWNYSACNGKDAPKESEAHVQWVALEHFIPRKPDGFNDQCRMFTPSSGVELVADKTDALREWEAIYGKRTE